MLTNTIKYVSLFTIDVLIRERHPQPLKEPLLGNRIKSVSVTKPVEASRMLLTGSIRTKVANDAKATRKGAEVQRKVVKEFM